MSKTILNYDFQAYLTEYVSLKNSSDIQTILKLKNTKISIELVPLCKKKFIDFYIPYINDSSTLIFTKKYYVILRQYDDFKITEYSLFKQLCKSPHILLEKWSFLLKFVSKILHLSLLTGVKYNGNN